ncbi:hypothetical protein [Kribbella sp. C-35]|uniref:hypothetical protein n=1 Tax=Kribbella sp. C-35 TaxID=2789276 RepID=UPI003978B813
MLVELFGSEVVAGWFGFEAVQFVAFGIRGAGRRPGVSVGGGRASSGSMEVLTLTIDV